MKKAFILATMLGGVALMASPGTALAGLGSVPAGWICNGDCGTDTADGDIPLSPLGNPTYEFISTTGAPSGVGYNPLGSTSPTNGSLLLTPTFVATTNTALTFYFNFITSDGGIFADNAWAALYTSTGTLVSEIYNSTTGAPIANPGASSVSWLGSWSGQCYAGGCGNTGWEAANYTITSPGSYYMAFGVTNAYDEYYDTGLAIDGVAINGHPVSAPEPASMALLGAGFLGLGMVRRRRAR